ncbi:MAG: P-loop NTPase, partial [Cyanobacteria bacterium NC_groundwater_1444_Ag_S-0.65um_54_12]|nr:P-loop NTPase [Cyanobacteria bacterium NC_groundwater_1444_Ag_S-0.65um_54_12]
MNTTRIILIFAARGGTGRSTLAANLATILAKRQKQATILLDLDWLSGGSLASALDLDPLPGHWGQATGQQKNLSELLVPHNSGIRLLGAPPAGSHLPPAPATLLKLLKELSRQADQILIDTTHPNLESEAMLALFDLAFPVLLIVTPDIPTLSATRSLLAEIRSGQYPMERVQVVLNRLGITEEIQPTDVTEHLGRPLLATIPFHPTVVTSLNRGIPISQTGGSGAVNSALNALAQKLMAMPVMKINSAERSILARANVYQTASASQSILASPAELLPPISAEQAMLATRELVPSGQQTVAAELPADSNADLLGVEVKLTIHRALVEDLKHQNLSLERLLDPQHQPEIRQQVEAAVGAILERLPALPVLSREQHSKLIGDITAEAIGYGPLERLLADPAVSEIMVNGPRQIYIERAGRLSLLAESFTDEAQLRVVID